MSRSLVLITCGWNSVGEVGGACRSALGAGLLAGKEAVSSFFGAGRGSTKGERTLGRSNPVA
ncbi:hypothetical protein, partial [Bellilinea sp.]|uniref:hypothetical protein n=1 Tax=Bellilinea sp. TaxID=2838785 RepID=UPI002ADD76C4